MYNTSVPVSQEERPGIDACSPKEALDITSYSSFVLKREYPLGEYINILVHVWDIYNIWGNRTDSNENPIKAFMNCTTTLRQILVYEGIHFKIGVPDWPT